MLSFISLNTRGLKDNIKRKAIFLFCKEQKANCVFLQETHSVEADTKFWKLQWGDSIFFSHGTSHSAGVMILFNRFPGKIIDHKRDATGYWLMVATEINDKIYILLCVYGYNKRAQNKTLFSSLSKYLEEWKMLFSTDRVIIGGDFNLAPDLLLDRLPSRRHYHTHDEIILELITKANLIDYWRMKNPTRKQFTWFNSSNNGQCSRLDYWLISDNLINEVNRCDISASPLTDHCVIFLTISLDGRETKINSIWKFNNNLLENTEFCNIVKHLVKEVGDLDMSFLSKWEWFKFKVKQIAISTSKQSTTIKKEKQRVIISRINSLCCKNELTRQEQTEINNLKSHLDNIYLEKAKGAFIRSRARWIEEGEKNSSYFFSLEKQRQTKKKIQKLNINGIIVDNQKEVNENIKVFYSNLYKSLFSKEDCCFFLDKIQGFKMTMDENFKQLMEEELRIEELDLAIQQMSRGKSPGIDGLTVEFLSFFWSDIREMLYNAYLDCISKGSLSPTMKHGLITLIPKPNKDNLLLDNWRPITLLCNDYKLLALVYANRLNKGLSHIIDECQSAFIKGRNIHNHTRLLLDMLDYRDFINTDAFILFLDFYKAFDTVEHTFLFEILDFLGFGSNFCNIIKMFYSDIYSSVSLNSSITPRFDVLRGIRQGCPISPKLFILATQSLILLINHNPDLHGISIFDKEFKISQFADDTAILLKNKFMVDVALNSVSIFSKASGLTLNVKKCELLPIHSSTDSIISSIEVKTEVKYLGIVLSKNAIRREDVNFSNRLVDMKKSLSRWLTRDLTIFGRVTLSKSEGISKVIYPCQSLYVSSDNVKKANSIIFQFLWKNKTHYIKKSQLVKEYDMGGIKALDFEAMFGTFKIKWLKTYLSQPDSMWFHIPRNLFKQVGGLDFLLQCDFEVTKIPVKLSKFHKQVLQYWKMIFTHNFSPHGSTLWNNRVIIINRKSLYKYDWYEKGIVFVIDILDDTGNLLEYKAFLEKYKLNCTHSKYKMICKAIPVQLLQLIQNILFYAITKPSPTLPNLVINECTLFHNKCNNKFISDALKSRLFFGYNRGLCVQVPNMDTLSIEKTHFNFIKWPISPKVKETHFKIIYKIYPVAEFLRRRFKFDVDPCVFCEEADETLEHMFFFCPVSNSFWSEIHNWLLFKMDNIPTINLSHILFYMDNLDSSISDLLNMIILLGKYHIHCCKWRSSKPSFVWFINDFKLFVSSLKKIQSTKIARKMCSVISKKLLF